jgi:glycosyltransferase involved in cell wall biosynthesis
MYQRIIDTNPLVSIGMPVYNSEQHICRALNSLLAQNYHNFELIISDNASTDHTLQLINEYAARDKRVRLSSNLHNLGVINNFIKVLTMAQGKYFMWAAADDFWEPEFVATLVDELEKNPGAGVALCAVRREYPDGQLKDIIKYKGKNNPNNFSNSQIALNLLSPNKRIRLLKFNLFIYGVFRLEAINELLPIAKDMFKFGERAFLSPIALSYRFRYVDKTLFVKTVYKRQYKERDPEEKVIKYRKGMKSYKYYYYYNIIIWITKYSKISLRNKFFVFNILHYILYIFITGKVKKLNKKKKKIFKSRIKNNSESD